MRYITLSPIDMHMDFGGAQTKVSINNQRTTSHAGLGNKYTRHTRKRATAVWFCWMKLQAKYHLSGNRSAFSWDSTLEDQTRTFITQPFTHAHLSCLCTNWDVHASTYSTQPSIHRHERQARTKVVFLIVHSMRMDFECVKTGVTKLGHTSQCLFHICTYVKPLTGIC